MKPATLEKIIKEAKENNLTFIEEVEGYANLYQFNSCGHSQLIAPPKIRNGQYACKECSFDTIKSEATSHGLTFIETSSGEYNLYKFHGCNHSQLLMPKHIRNGQFSCKCCAQEKIKSEALTVGLEYVSKGYGRKNIYKFKKCNHKQEIGIVHVRNNSFCCHECNESYATKESGIYILKITNSKGESWLKFGVSSNIKRRISQYKLNKNTQCEILFDKKYPTNQQAVLLEKGIHRIFKEKALCSTKMKKLMKSGFTECYNLSMLNPILSKL